MGTLQRVDDSMLPLCKVSTATEPLLHDVIVDLAPPLMLARTLTNRPVLARRTNLSRCAPPTTELPCKNLASREFRRLKDGIEVD